MTDSSIIPQGLDACEAPHPKGGYLCTRERHDGGRHEAGFWEDGRLLAAWGDDDELAQLERKTEELAQEVRRIRERVEAGDGGLPELLAAGHAVSFTYEPADGYRAVIDVFVDDDTVTTHAGIAATPAGALAAARAGMGREAAAGAR